MCCCPKKKDGLGIKNLRILNEALLSKLAASIHAAEDGVLAFLKCRFLNDVNVPMMVCSSVWGSL